MCHACSSRGAWGQATNRPRTALSFPSVRGAECWQRNEAWVPSCLLPWLFMCVSLTSPTEVDSRPLRPGSIEDPGHFISMLMWTQMGGLTNRSRDHRQKPSRLDRPEQRTPQGGALGFDSQIGKTTQGSQHTLDFTGLSRGGFSSTGQEHGDRHFPYPSSSGLRLANRKGSA